MIINRFMVMERLKELTKVRDGEQTEYIQKIYISGQIAECMFWLDIAENTGISEIESETKKKPKVDGL